MVTKGMWKFGVSASQPDVYDACNGMERHFYHLQTLRRVPGGHHSRGEQKGGYKARNVPRSVILVGRIWFKSVVSYGKVLT